MTVTESDRIVTPRAVSARTSLSRTTIWRMVRKGQFPAPIPLSDNRIGWPESAITAWLTQRAHQTELRAA